MNKFAVIISGPTASGKTDLSLSIAQQLPCEIVNADMGQFYLPISVGTAKPDWKNETSPHHLFDIIKSPINISSFEFRDLIINKVEELNLRNKIPLIVGGSGFYLKSLFLPPSAQTKSINKSLSEIPEELLWKRLQEIDPVRASELHPHDIYRIKRALDIWYSTNTLPSRYKPVFKPPFNFVFIFINPPREILYEKINLRALQLLGTYTDSPWIAEVKPLINTDWEKFLKEKGLIGYKEIIEWIREGENKNSFPALVEEIQKQTRNYAKRQITFWKSFCDNLTKNRNSSPFNYTILTLDEINIDTLNQIVDLIKSNLEINKLRF